MPYFPPDSGTVDDATIATSDITTNNFSTTKHGWCPKGTNVGNFLKDDGTFAAPSGSGDMILASAQTVTGAKTFNSSKLILAGATSGTTTLNVSATGISSTFTIPSTTTDLSATGGTGHVLKQASAGGAITSGTIVGGSDTQIQFNDGGSILGGDADFTWDKTLNTLSLKGTDTGIDVKGITTEPSAPTAGVLHLYSKLVSGRMLPKILGPSGVDTPLQTALFGNNIICYTPTNGASVTATFGAAWAKGGSAGLISHPNPTTGICNQIHRTRHANAVTTTNQAMGITAINGSGLMFWRGNAAGQGGFFFNARFVIGLWAADTCRLFCGLGKGTEIVISDTVANDTVGLWHDTTDGANVLSLVTRDAATTTKTAITGATVAAGQGFDFYMFCKPNDSTIYYRLDSINAGTTIVDTSIATTLPTNTVFIGPQVEVSNGTASTVVTTVAMDVARIYVESDH